MEENIKRKELPWQDLTVAIGNLHQLYVENDPNWSQASTSQAISLNEGTLSQYLKVYKYIDEERIRKCTSARQAYEVIDRRETRRQEAAFAQLLEGDYDEDDPDTYPDIFDDEPASPVLKPLTQEQIKTAQELDLESRGLVKVNGIWTADPNRPPITIEGKPEHKPERRPANGPSLAESIIHTSFLEWAPSYSGSRFNFIHCDFPYGAVEVGPQMEGNETQIYNDSPEIYMNLLECFCDNLDKFFSVSGWIMFWYSERLGRETRDMFKYKCPSLEVQTHPLIWLHSDNSGISSDYKWRPRHIYDTALLIHRGDMPMAKLKADAYAAPGDRKIHPSTKPEPMLRFFFEMVVDNHTSMLDPTCGSGASIRAAESLGASRTLGIELDWQYCEAARLALKDSRAKLSILRGI
jgi:hypothetical protein